MSQDVLTVGSTMRIPLLYRGEYSQWVERFMNYLEEQTDGEAMINSIKTSDQPLPLVTQVSIAGTTSTEKPPLKDKSIVQPIDCLARSLLIQGLSNDIYSLIDSNKTAKDLWDALARHMLGSEYGEQDRKVAVLYEYKTFKAIEGELLFDTYIRYLQVINDLKKCGYSKDNCELNFKFLNNLQPEWKQYVTMMRQNKNLMDINIDALYNILKQNQGDMNDAMGSKKKTVVDTSDPLSLIAEKTNVSRSKEKVVVSLDSEGSETDDFNELKKITAFLAKDFNRRNFYSKPTNNNLRTSSSYQSANKKQEFVKTDTKKVEKKDDEKKRDMSRVKCYNCKKEGHFAKDCKKVKVKDYEYYKTKMLLVKKDKDEQVLLAKHQAWMESSSDSDQEINANMVFMAQIEKVLSDSEASSSSAYEKNSEVSYYLSETEKETVVVTSDPLALIVEKTNVSRSKEKVVVSLDSEGSEADDFSELKKITALLAKAFNRRKFYSKQPNNKLRTSSSYQSANKKQEFVKTDTKKVEKKDDEKKRDMSKIKCYNCKKEGHFAKDYKKAKVKDYEYYKTKMLLAKKDKDEQASSSSADEKISEQTSSLKSYVPNVILEKIIIDLEDEVVSLLEKERANLETIKSLKSKGFESSETVSSESENQSENDCHVVEKQCGNMKSSKVIAPGMFKLNVSQHFSSVRRPKNSSVIWKKKGSFNTSNVGLSAIVQICLWIIDSGCSKHMTGNRALLTNFVNKFLETVRFGHNDFTVIAGYGDVVIGSITIKKV
uniref:CCHC-type domain-containing protein n=1 Tax=Tanacetum cinerariifolium TaxID=118510 RepID=A0A6L2LUC7_TANCI|nr:hypothetical protein [Tanacetum cinerariifolium]